MDRWGNYHSKLVLGDDIAVEYAYHYGRAPRESLSVTVVTVDGLVYEFYTVELESFCKEYGLLTEELKQQIINEVKRNASKMRFEVKNEERLRGASEELRRFVEELKQAYYCSVYPYHHFCRE